MEGKSKEIIVPKTKKEMEPRRRTDVLSPNLVEGDQKLAKGAGRSTTGDHKYFEGDPN
jgi:hypothetical protein